MAGLSNPPTKGIAAGVVSWRGQRLMDAGFPRDLASRLARDCRYDLHALIELTERGCPPALAARIQAPVETGSGGC